MLIDQIDVRKRALDPSGSVGEAWAAVGSSYWILLGVIVVAGLILLASSMIPLASIVIVPFISGPLLAGVQGVFLDVTDGKSADFGKMFDGFKKFGPNVAVALIVSIPMFLLQGAQLLTLIPQANIFDAAQGSPEIMTGVAAGFIAVAIAGTLAYYALIFLTYFSYLLIMEHDVDAITAIKLSTRGVIGNIGRMILLVIFIWLLWLLGFVAFCIGMLFIAPVIFLSNTNAYRHIYPKTIAEPVDYNPPSPDRYGDMFGQIS